MKTLVVCGCSWSSRDPVYPNFEYGYLVAKKLGYNYINLARCGMSNFGIRLQIDYALKHLDPDLMIINATGVNRFEILKELDNKYDHNKAYDQICFGDFDWDHFDHEHHINFDKTYDSQIWCDSIYTVISQEARRCQHIDKDFENYQPFDGLGRPKTSNLMCAFKPHNFWGVDSASDDDCQRFYIPKTNLMIFHKKEKSCGV